MASTAVSPALSSGPASNLLESLPARPPTPPREAHHEPESLTKSHLNRSLSLDPKSSLQTPPNAASPTSSLAASTDQSLRRIRKRVEWSNRTEFKEPPQYRDGQKDFPPSPDMAPSSASNPPSKGILKSTSSPQPTSFPLEGDANDNDGKTNVVELLESTVKQLAGRDRASKLDAYMVLTRALKASNNLPDRVALQDKMGLFMHFIQRDIACKNEDESLDTTMSTHALNLLITFLHYSAIASTLTLEFAATMTDLAIRSFESPIALKQVTRCWMQIIACQNFSSKVMTLDRVGRLVGSLHTIEDRVRGKGIVLGRIHTYRQLIRKSRSHMVNHSLWLEDLLMDMASDVKAIREQAISLGLEAGFALGSEKPLVRKISEIFQMADENQTYGEFYLSKLDNTMKSEQRSASASQVPQILSVLALFVRGPLEKWKHHSRWLQIFQKAFNSSDLLTKQEANYAWNRYAYLCLVDTKISSKLLSTLCQPLISQIRRKVAVKQSEEGVKVRHTVILSICNLYYYAFAPNSNKHSPDIMWDIAVQPIIHELIQSQGKPGMPRDCMVTASKLLIGLLDSSTPRIWRHNRILDLPPPKFDEIPSIDVKWIRKNCNKVFRLVGPILEDRYLEVSKRDSWAFRLWSAFVGSISKASSKEIKVSEDTANFVAGTLNLLQRVWSKGSMGSGTDVKAHLSSVACFVRVVIDGIALLPFTEKKLCMTTGSTFEPVATPSHHPERQSMPLGIIRTAFQHLFLLLTTIPEGASDDETYSIFFQEVFDPFFAQRSARVKLDLLRELDKMQPDQHTSPLAIWILTAKNIEAVIGEQLASLNENSSSAQRMPGVHLREMVSHLETGVSAYPNMPRHIWFSYFDRLSQNLVHHFGDAGRTIVLIEPLSQCLLANLRKKEDLAAVQCAELPLDILMALFEIGKLPIELRAIEAARRRLWGSGQISSKNAVDLLGSLFQVAGILSPRLYEHLAVCENSHKTDSFLSSISKLLQNSSKSSLRVLSHPDIQKTLLPWIQDRNARLKSSDDGYLSPSFIELWDQIRSIISSESRSNGHEIEGVEPLLIAALTSTHAYTVQKAVELWNGISKQQEEPIKCSDSLRSVISSLGSKVDIGVSGQMSFSAAHFGAQATSLHSDLSPILIASGSKGSDGIHRSAGEPFTSQGTLKRRLSQKRKKATTPEASNGKNIPKTSTPRLRHDDSQIEFAPIVSPPPLKESQHLTERQKAVRARQIEDAAIYKNVHSSSPGRPRFEAQSPIENLPQMTTPERKASYEQLISSTPTPKRGQFVAIEDLGDPPSSPPEPRPYPLREQIESRLRTGSSLDSWEFSSPVASPANRQQVAHDADAADPTSTRGAAQRAAKRKREPEAGISEADMDLSSQPLVPKGTDSKEIAGSLLDTPQHLLTPIKRSKRLSARGQETPRSGQEEFAKAQVNLKTALPTTSGVVDEQHVASGDSSFAMSGLDDDNMMNLVVELENRSCSLPLASSPPESPARTSDIRSSALPCITVFSSPGITADSLSADPDLRYIPSTPPEAFVESPSSDSGRRKRRRSGRNAETRNKRRRSEDAEMVGGDGDDDISCVAETQVVEGPSFTEPAHDNRRSVRSGNLQTRKSSRQSERQSKMKAQNSVRKEKEKVRPGAEDNTDEEVMSQLIEESNAASQSLSQQNRQQEEQLIPVPSITTSSVSQNQNESPAKNSKNGAKRPSVKAVMPQVEETGHEPAARTVAASILQTLQKGLDGLRTADLERDDVHKLEDLLMDMKRELYEAERRGRGKSPS